ncbi:MAG: flagellar hook capping FlgD N-terminal domain-containing protein [Paracoccaceae bacterium]
MDTNLATSQIAATNRTAAPVQSSSVLSSDFETFLKMLTAQAKHQDPLEPLDSSEYASQLAQFSAVEQQVLSNDLLTAMVAQMGTSNMAQLAGWVGMEARSAAPVSFAGSPVTLEPKPMPIADQAFLVVRNAAGDEVQRNVIPVTTDPVVWAGVGDDGTPFPAGDYSFEVESFAGGAMVLSNPVETYARIVEARNNGNGQTELILQGGQPVLPDDISALRAPG